MNNNMDLNDEELRELHSETWRQLKADPNAARRILAEAGWIRPRREPVSESAFYTASYDASQIVE